MSSLPGVFSSVDPKTHDWLSEILDIYVQQEDVWVSSFSSISRLGVDASSWFCVAGTALARLSRAFHGIATMSRLSVDVVFVFGHDPVPDEDVLKILIAAFGYHSHQAPGSVLAELARMNREGVIDAVLSGSFEVILYGAQAFILRPVYDGLTTGLDVLRLPLTSDAVDHPSRRSLLLYILIMAACILCPDPIRPAPSTVFAIASHLQAHMIPLISAAEAYPKPWNLDLDAWLLEFREALRIIPGAPRFWLQFGFPDLQYCLPYVHVATSWSHTHVDERPTNVHYKRGPVDHMAIEHWFRFSIPNSSQSASVLYIGPWSGDGDGLTHGSDDSHSSSDEAAVRELLDPV